MTEEEVYALLGEPLTRDRHAEGFWVSGRDCRTGACIEYERPAPRAGLSRKVRHIEDCYTALDEAGPTENWKVRCVKYDATLIVVEKRAYTYWD